MHRLTRDEPTNAAVVYVVDGEIVHVGRNRSNVDRAFSLLDRVSRAALVAFIPGASTKPTARPSALQGAAWYELLFRRRPWMRTFF